MPPDRYTLAISPGYRVLVFAMMIGFSLIGVGMIVVAVLRGVQTVPLPLILFWSGAGI